MAKQVIGIGTTANDGTGDSLRTSGSKTNDNFGEVYTLLGDGWTLPTGIVTTLTAGDNIALSGSTGNVTITGTASTANINADSLVVAGVTTLSDLNATGDVTATTFTGNLTGNVTGDVTGTATTATNLADAANITTGTIADARFPATLPPVSGVDLTGIVTSITAGDNISVSGATGNVTITGLANTSNVSADTLVVTGVSTLGIM